MSLSAYHSPQNYKMTCHRPSKSGLHLPVFGMEPSGREEDMKMKVGVRELNREWEKE